MAGTDPLPSLIEPPGLATLEEDMPNAGVEEPDLMDSEGVAVDPPSGTRAAQTLVEPIPG